MQLFNNIISLFINLDDCHKFLYSARDKIEYLILLYLYFRIKYELLIAVLFAERCCFRSRAISLSCRTCNLLAPNGAFARALAARIFSAAITIDGYAGRRKVSCCVATTKMRARV